MAYVLWFLVAGIGGAVAGQALRGRPLAGFYLGLLLGPFALIAMAFLADMRVRAPTQGAFAGLASGVARDGFCLRCGVEAYSQAEMGQIVYVCPKCGGKL